MGPRHILLVEDEQHMRRTLALILKRAGYRVSLAADGAEAIEAILVAQKKGAPVDLLLTDLQMPVLTGMELVEELRRLKIALPTVVLTGYGARANARQLEDWGCTECIDKPFSAQDLLERVETVLAVGETEGSLKQPTAKHEASP